MTALLEKAAGLLVVRLGSNMVPPRYAEDDARSVGALAERFPIGGVILFNGRGPETRETLKALQERAAMHPGARGLLVMTDMERGIGQQVGGGVLYPHLAALGAVAARDRGRGMELTRRFAETGGRAALALGVHVAFAPVADVDRNPQNPIISTRAFGSDPDLVADLVAAYHEGARAAGLLTTAKHFPGHGGTAEDSHAVTPVVPDSREQLEATDLVPFRRAVAEGVDLMMTAHVRVPALDPSGAPATRSHAILTDLLRGDFGFTGPVVTDSLHMGGIHTADETEGQRAVAMVAAGVDLLLDAQDPEAIIHALAQAVTEGTLSEARLDEALACTEGLRDRLRTRFGGDVFRDPEAAYPPSAFGSEDEAALALEIAREALEVTGDASGFRNARAPFALLVRPHALHLDPDEQPLGDALRAAFPGVRYHEVGPDLTPEDAARIETDARGADAVLIAAVVKPAAWHAYGLRPEQELLVEAVLAGRPDAVLVSLGHGRVMEAYPGAADLTAWSDVPAAQHAVVERLQGP